VPPEEESMIELPEAAALAEQINRTISGKSIKNAAAAQSPHKFAWYFGDPQEYRGLLAGKVISGAMSYGGHVEIAAGNAKILFSDGVTVRHCRNREELPDKHQLLLELDDGSFLVGSVQMYGGLWAFPEGKNDNEYYLKAREKPSPLSDGFDDAYFNSLFSKDTDRLSLKAFLATEQRIPGLGNGVLQDILFNAKMPPKKKVSTLSAADRSVLFEAIKTTLSAMAAHGGRDTENDLSGTPGGYKTILSRNTVGQPCPACGASIQKEAYMGGSVYYCARCQST